VVAEAGQQVEPAAEGFEVAGDRVHGGDFAALEYSMMAPLFEHYGVQLWTPEAGGPVYFQTEEHDLAMIALGIQALVAGPTLSPRSTACSLASAPSASPTS
jgi:hypothetical protein